MAHYTPDQLGPACRWCYLAVPIALAQDSHPSCGPEARALLGAERARIREERAVAGLHAMVDLVNSKAAS